MKLEFMLIALMIIMAISSSRTLAGTVKDTNRRYTRIPDDLPPGIGCWFWIDEEFQPGGYKRFIDASADNAPFDFLTTSIRANKEVTDPAVRDQIKAAAEYANSRGIGIVMDLDIRLARSEFQKAYPNELQEMLRLREVDLSASEPATLSIRSAELGDHYTFNGTPYISVSGKLVKVYSYIKAQDGIQKNTVEDITSACSVVSAGTQAVDIQLPYGDRYQGRTACVMAAFTHMTPDVFAPHLLKFQRDILEGYAGVPLAGACKDEWGFPPCFDGNPEKNDYWYSKARDKEYKKLSGGRDLVRDCLLMFAGEQGREQERQAAINMFMMMSTKRNVEIEQDFYRTVKHVFGSSAFVGTHPTWYPVPDSREFMKNGLDWWAVRRDYAQTDEVTPYAVRTALSKKCSSTVWYNMYYSSNLDDYREQLWSNLLAGGKVNYHPQYPVPDLPVNVDHYSLLKNDIMRGEGRVRLLSYITKSAIDSPVAVVFGHACAMNWAGPHYDDIGVKLANAIWKLGYPVDLIPSSEISNKSLKVNSQGWVQYGKQRYSTVVMYHPEFEGDATADFIEFAIEGISSVFRVGDWTVDSDGKPFERSDIISKITGLSPNPDDAALVLAEQLRKMEVEPQYSIIDRTDSVWGAEAGVPPTQGTCRLLDGTEIMVSGSNNPDGDRIVGDIKLCGKEIEVDVCGYAAARIVKNGNLITFAAGGLKKFRYGSIDIELETPLDLVLMRDSKGKMSGIVQGLTGKLPNQLLFITGDWLILDAPSDNG
ncbi:MAG: hypothetical protein ACYC27_00620 [Armatimonadota bacterium]